MRRIATACLLLASCSGGRLTSSQAAAACVVLASCFPHEFAAGYFGSSLAACASGVDQLPPSPGALIGNQGIQTGLEGPLGDVYACLAKSSGCTAAATCLGRAGASGSCASPSTLWDAGCAGTVLEGCLADGVAFDVDCAKYGEGCRVDFPQSDRPLAMCDEGACPAAGTQCEGSQEQVCLGPGVVLDDCARVGLSCFAPPSGGAECYVEGTPCSPGAAACNGTTLLSCQGGVPEQFDCSQSGTFKRCSNGACSETGSQCTVAADAPSCDGTKVKLCQDGNEVEVDCAGLGFSGCQDAVCH
ncbi:MAG TPA: hypothetical protein VMB50_09370 [Myxococcales bacterium]|nr:hypothetical protein [Myxococcales bacterium]